jgi:hypothetical protein
MLLSHEAQTAVQSSDDKLIYYFSNYLVTLHHLEPSDYYDAPPYTKSYTSFEVWD